MRKNVTIGFSPQEYLRLNGAAAVAKLPLSTYVKWLIQQEPSGGPNGRSMAPVLERLDDIATAIAKLPSRAEASTSQGSRQRGELPAAEVLATRLRERGIPTSTSRQVIAVLDELKPMEHTGR